MAESIELLEERINQVEISLRRYRFQVFALIIFSAASAGFAMVGAMGARHENTFPTRTDEIKAREFIVVNQADQPIGAFGDFAGQTGLLLVAQTQPERRSAPSSIAKLSDGFTHNGGIALSSAPTDIEMQVRGGTDGGGNVPSIDLELLGPSAGTASFALTSRTGRIAKLYVDDPAKLASGQALLGESSLTLSEAPSSGVFGRRIYLSEYSDGSADLDFDAENLRHTLEIDSTTDNPSISLFDRSDKRAAFMLQTSGEPLLALWSAGEKYSGDYISDDQISLIDADKNIRATLGASQLENRKTGSTEDTGPSSLVFFDKKGK